VISQPFWSAYMTAERFAKAPKLKLIITAGIGSDHTDHDLLATFVGEGYIDPLIVATVDSGGLKRIIFLRVGKVDGKPSDKRPVAVDLPALRKLVN
jgi:hypothetical protein